jgi:hypothetical protein
MPIISDRHRLATQQQQQNKSSVAGASFAERIEAGSSARQVTRERALGFSETGLLGLHYAHNLSNKQATPPKMQHIPIAKSYRITTEKLSVRPDVAISSPANKDVPKYNITFAPMDSKEISLRLAKNDLNYSSSANRCELMAVDVGDQADTIQPATLKSFQKAILQTGSKFRVALKIIETSQGISVQCDEELFYDDTLEEFSELASQIAKDFGVTIRGLIVNRYMNKF